MHRFAGITARFVLVLAILAAAQVVTSVSPSGSSPYLSALSATQSAIAAPNCNGKTCAKDPRHGPTCFSAAGSNCTKQSNGCFSNAC